MYRMDKVKAPDFKNKLDRIHEVSRNFENLKVCIKVERAGVVGSSPTVEVKNVSAGFDWDNGKLIIYPESLLREVDRDELDMINKKMKEAGWNYYEFSNLKRENVKLKQKIQELQKAQDNPNAD